MLQLSRIRLGRVVAAATQYEAVHTATSAQASTAADSQHQLSRSYPTAVPGWHSFHHYHSQCAWVSRHWVSWQALLQLQRIHFQQRHGCTCFEAQRSHVQRCGAWWHHQPPVILAPAALQRINTSSQQRPHACRVSCKQMGNKRVRRGPIYGCPGTKQHTV